MLKMMAYNCTSHTYLWYDAEFIMLRAEFTFYHYRRLIKKWTNINAVRS
jgi:hypothetical protein